MECLEHLFGCATLNRGLVRSEEDDERGGKGGGYEITSANEIMMVVPIEGPPYEHYECISDE